MADGERYGSATARSSSSRNEPRRDRFPTCPVERSSAVLAQAMPKLDQTTATKRRKNGAHGASRGFLRDKRYSPERAKEPGEEISTPLSRKNPRPSEACARHPRE